LSTSPTARHNALHRALTQRTSGPTDTGPTGPTDTGRAAAGRTGAILAISTGLLATASLPAQAVGGIAPPTVAAPAAGPAAASAPAYSAQPHANALAAARLDAGSSAFTAPSTAVVSFESGAFTAVPKPVVRTTPPAHGTAGRTQVRRSSSSGSSSAASSGSSSSTGASTTGGTSARGSSVLSVAARYIGTPYLYGGTTPKGFDCSGYTRYVFKQLGISLPRTANQQMNATRRISRSEARPGDLVFFVSGGSAYHTGIYAGNGMMYDAPSSGKTVQKREIWDATIVFGRVTG
jgi:cell wall-associated NlpC family hydrolase